MFNVGFVSLLQYSRYSNELRVISSLKISHQNLNTHQNRKITIDIQKSDKILQNVINTTGSNMYNINIKPYRILNSSGNKMQEK